MLKDIYTFKCFMPIVAKARARATIVKNNKYAAGVTVQLYTPKATKNFEQELKLRFNRWLISVELPRSPKLAIEMWVEFTHQYKGKGPRPKHKTSKPDCSNLVKSVEDALNGSLYHDDSQITELHVSKKYGDRDEITIRFRYLEDIC